LQGEDLIEILLFTEIDDLQPGIRNEVIDTFMDTRCWHFHLGIEKYAVLEYENVLPEFLFARGKG